MLLWIIPLLHALTLTNLLVPMEHNSTHSLHHASHIINYQYAFSRKTHSPLLHAQKQPSASTLNESVLYDEVCNLEAFDDFFGKERAIIAEALRDIPCGLVQNLREVVIYTDATKPRAMASRTRLHLRSDLFDLPEAKNVLIHELGHIVDLSGIESTAFQNPSPFRDGKRTLYQDDPSILFYLLSWQENTEWQSRIHRNDFVTGYAATDPFEDFSESFLFYIERGRHFRELTKHSPVLAQKYSFLRREIFDEKEFETGDVPETISHRAWDGTKG